MSSGVRYNGGTGWKKEEDLLFEDDADRERFLSRLADRVEQYNIRLYRNGTYLSSRRSRPPALHVREYGRFPWRADGLSRRPASKHELK